MADPSLAVGKSIRYETGIVGVIAIFHQLSCNLCTQASEKPFAKSEFPGGTQKYYGCEMGQQPIDPTIFGFQFQRGTRWNPGLSEDRIAEYEPVLGVRFPHDFRDFLGVMNGTDLPTMNIYGSGGEPPRRSVGVYSYPRDLGTVKLRIENVRESRDVVAADLRNQGLDLHPEAALIPIYQHRYVVCTSDLNRSVVLSIVTHATDAIVYGNSLQEYLEREFIATL